MLYYIFHNDEERRHFLGAISPINIMETIVTLWVMGITESTLPYVSYGIADISLPADVATVIISLSPLCSYGMGFLFHFYDKKLKKAIVTKKTVAGIILGFLGAALVVARPYIGGTIRGTPIPISVIEPWVVAVFLFGVICMSFSATYWSHYGVFLKTDADGKVQKKKKLMHFLAGWEEMLLVF